MTAKEILEKIKAAFDVVVPVQPNPGGQTPDSVTPDTSLPGTNKTGENVVSYNVAGAAPVYVDISDDNIADIDAGDAVYADQSLQTPYPDGTYQVSGTNFSFVVTAGVVTSTVDPDGTGAGTPIQDMAAAPAPVTKDIDKDAVSGPDQRPTPPLQPQTKVMPGQNDYPSLKYEAMEKEVKAAKDKLDAAEKRIEAQEGRLKLMMELCEKLIAEPTADPVTLTGKEKSRFEKEQKVEERFKAIADSFKQAKTLKRY